MLNARIGNTADKVESRLLSEYSKHKAEAGADTERSMRI